MPFIDNEDSLDELPFIAEFVTEFPDVVNAVFTTQELLWLKSGKGLLIKTESFKCMAWKASKAYLAITSAIEDMVGQESGEILIQPKSTGNYLIAVNEGSGVLWLKSHSKAGILYSRMQAPPPSEKSPGRPKKSP